MQWQLPEGQLRQLHRCMIMITNHRCDDGDDDDDDADDEKTGLLPDKVEGLLDGDSSSCSAMPLHRYDS